MTQTPKPKRPKITGLWWKLPLSAVPVVIGLVILALAVWSRVERGRVMLRVDALRAAGQPVEVRDLVEPSVGDADNLAVPIRAALAAFVAEKDTRRRDAENDDPHAFELPLTDAEAAILIAHVDANAAALAELARLDGRRAAAWGLLPPKGAVIDVLLPHLNGGRAQANLLRDVARLGARDGRWDEALVALARIEPLAAGMGGDFLVTSLVATGIRALAADAIIEVAPDLAADAPRDRVRALIATLLDDATPARASLRGLVAERVFMREMLGQLRHGNFGVLGGRPGGTPMAQQVLGVAAAPMIYRGEWAALDYMNALIAIADAPDQAAFDARAAGPQRQLDAIKSARLTMIASSVVPSLNRVQSTVYRVLADRHLAACALALRLYQFDHAGARPATLDALVPDYLPAVPLDAIDGRPIRYDPARAILWSVGIDGKDDAGNPTPPKPEYAGSRWQMKDAVVWLDRQPRPATQPAE